VFPGKVENQEGGTMRLSVKGIAIAFAIIWGACLLFVGLVHLASPAYGASFLTGVSSVYPGFHGGRSFVDVIVGTIYALVDGFVGGAIFGWLYDIFAAPAPQM
jgi:hypothetical protein